MGARSDFGRKNVLRKDRAGILQESFEHGFPEGEGQPVGPGDLQPLESLGLQLFEDAERRLELAAGVTIGKETPARRDVEPRGQPIDLVIVRGSAVLLPGLLQEDATAAGDGAVLSGRKDHFHRWLDEVGAGLPPVAGDQQRHFRGHRVA